MPTNKRPLQPQPANVNGWYCFTRNQFCALDGSNFAPIFGWVATKVRFRCLFPRHMAHGFFTRSKVTENKYRFENDPTNIELKEKIVYGTRQVRFRQAKTLAMLYIEAKEV